MVAGSESDSNAVGHVSRGMQLRLNDTTRLIDVAAWRVAFAGHLPAILV